MRNFVLLILFSILFISIDSTAQILDPVKGPRAWKKDNVEQKEAPHLTYVREADVFWAERIWRTVDLRQKINLPLYYPYPAGDSATHGKRSLMQIIYDEFIYGPAQNPSPNDIKLYTKYELRQQDEISAAEVLANLTVADSALAPDSTGNMVNKLFTKRFQANEVTKFLLMEDYFFDKQRSVMDVRILAFGFEYPIYKMITDIDPITYQATFKEWKKMPEGQIYWFFFPQMRPTLASLEVYNRFNDAKRLSYDDIFLKREFGSYITKKENVYDRKINEYTKGLNALLEAEKIKNDIFEFEQSLWEY